MLFDECINLRSMFAIADTCPDNNFIEPRQVRLRGILDRNQCDLMVVLFNKLPQSLTDGQGLAIGGGIDNKDPGHFPLCDVLAVQ